MEVNLNKFQEFYNKLNTEQKRAVDFIEGTVMVMAGPGTGKTQVLILRVANILLKTQIDPGNILVLTFTENGATTIRRRLIEIVGRAAYYVNIFTFHGFCNDLIKNNGENFSKFLSFKPANEISQINLVREALNEGDLKILRPFGEPFFYVKEILNAISNLKREAVGINEFNEILKKQQSDFNNISDLYYESGRYVGKMKGRHVEAKKQLEKNFELCKMYELYEDKLRVAKLYDYDDMILEVLKTLNSNKDFLLNLQEKFQYILVDEHQDTNNAQNKLVEFLGNFYENPNLFVVGDANQAIFRFQGANLSNFLYFKNLYESVQLVSLKKNYRSTQNILDASHSLISKTPEDVSENLISEVNLHGEPIEFYEFKRLEAEYYFLSKKLSGLISEGVPPEEIAVIYRENRDVFPLRDMLNRYDIPYRIESNLNVLDDLDIGKLIAIFQFISKPQDDEKLFEILHMDFLNIPALDIYKVCNLFYRSKISFVELLSNKEKLLEAQISSHDVLFHVVQKLMGFRSDQFNYSLTEFFERVVRDIGYLNYVLSKSNSLEGLNRLDGLFSELKKIVEDKPDANLNDFINYLDTLTLYNVSLREKSKNYIPNAVRLMTAHGAKGLEFNYVFIINVSYGHWGDRKNRNLIKLPQILVKNISESDPNDEERRLFYVALTRARKKVFISLSLKNLTGKEQYPSLFIEEIRSDLLKRGVSDKYEKELEFNKELLFAPKINKGFSLAEKDYLMYLFEKQGLSATSLNNFLDCPLKYFYVNLLRIPKASTRHQVYGRALHAALKDFFDALKNDSATSKFLILKFEEHLKKEPVTKINFEQILVKGKNVLMNYWDKYNGLWNTNVFNEFRVNKVYLSLAQSEPVKLTGSLDKIEFGSSGLNVVDYKTGKPKSGNSLVDYRRQLTFYKLLLDEYRVLGKEMVSGEIDFVEPNARGVYRKEKFEIGVKDVEELKKVIREVVVKIRDLSFWNEGCEKRDCEFCRLRVSLS